MPSLYRNGQNWVSEVLGEHALLVRPENEELEHIHKLISEMEGAGLEGIIDIVPAYSSLAVFFDGSKWDHHTLIAEIENLSEGKSSVKAVQNMIEIPVCYELGMDWKDVIRQTGLEKEQIIELHNSKIYTIAMMGFIPGFIFLNGLDAKLAVPRKSTPRTGVPAGSIGIGGNQTGMYSLESPGGWNIIGRSPKSFFDSSKNPPTLLKAGDKVKFTSISEKEFHRG
ncbi:MAG: 5-oxoprolinase subunit PxpB [Balneolaceae bacterium]|nr:5-oxoprolinase subunit PxpB [Balneolaceae bacterium]MBO6546864.1 5-oxoprolinase subunit PxpB [Balneolaceae bacterium]MBO6649224.1 5-oxoprolinase subunit PxpB [Balneolaceae bacterium]